jgi:hypothetical protein
MGRFSSSRKGDERDDQFEGGLKGAEIKINIKQHLVLAMFCIKGLVS